MIINSTKKSAVLEQIDKTLELLEMAQERSLELRKLRDSLSYEDAALNPEKLEADGKGKIDGADTFDQIQPKKRCTIKKVTQPYHDPFQDDLIKTQPELIAKDEKLNEAKIDIVVTPDFEKQPPTQVYMVKTEEDHGHSHIDRNVGPNAQGEVNKIMQIKQNLDKVLQRQHRAGITDNLIKTNKITSLFKSCVKKTTEEKPDSFMFIPQNSFKLAWDVFISGVLLYSCIVTPAQIALYEDLDGTPKILNYVCDVLFFFDILIIFNSAVFDYNDYKLIIDRCNIAKIYLKSWFWIDLIAIVPFDLFMSTNGEAAHLVRFTRIGRVYKILRLLKLLRLMQLHKSKSSGLMNCLSETFPIGEEGKWMINFLIYFAMTTHIVACIWIISGTMDPDSDGSWLSDYDVEERSKVYLTSFYFTVTTITTVGYGDMSGNTSVEKTIVIFIMLIGVIGFSLTSGALTNFISATERKSEMLEKKLELLNRLNEKHGMEQDLYVSILRNIEHNDVADFQEVANFIDELPLDLRTQLSTLIYKDVYEKVDFLKSKSNRFIAWICPMLKTRVVAAKETIYHENDPLNRIYFLKSGGCQYVLPKYANTPFIQILEHTCFGLIDFVAALISKTSNHDVECGGIISIFQSRCGGINGNGEEHLMAEEHKKDESEMFDGLKRRFSVMADDSFLSELLMINKEDMLHMQIQFGQEYTEFFEKGIGLLEKTITLRIHSMDLCHKQMVDGAVSCNIETLTNRRVNEMTLTDVLSYCKGKPATKSRLRGAAGLVIKSNKLKKSAN